MSCQVEQLCHLSQKWLRKSKKKNVLYFYLLITIQLQIILDPPSNVFFQLVFISWMVTLSSCLIWQILVFERIWLCIRLNNAGKYCDITLKITIMLQNVCENCVWILEEEKPPPYVRYLVKETSILIDNQSAKSKKQCVHPRIMLLWQKVCVWSAININSPSFSKIEHFGDITETNFT